MENNKKNLSKNLKLLPYMCKRISQKIRLLETKTMVSRQEEESQKLMSVKIINFLSLVKPKSYEEASREKSCVKAIEEYLNQIQKKNTLELVPKLMEKNVIGTKFFRAS